MKVKIQLPVEGAGDMALVTGFEEKEPHAVMFRMPIAVTAVKKRFRPGETNGYFEASIVDGGTLEVGERISDLGW